ncbi:prepilin peptidase [Pseudomonas sp. MAFF 311095]|uniref:Prepilin peptidase n=1 Tax=Pseudomonas petroselini TaxID=2899822 RepID=A0ABS8R276_9PSED|nr:prepilin peptidase [Pseudomonas petroselini]MCD7048212.1 prepilin peptidase [Pseudomonas petroselini]MCD7071816.1 prepilin peptidase [Pseudomonas petroselini]MCD7082754.1 prepilin peptidase [Pseudomonas petroselini]
MIHGVVIVLWLGLCALQDGRQRQISNGLTLGVALLALLYLAWMGTTWLGAPANEGGWAFTVALLLTLPGYALGRFGAGDVKLLAALALASTLDAVLWSLIGAALFLGGWGLISQRLSARRLAPANEASKKQPFAPFVLTGFALYWFWIH